MHVELTSSVLPHADVFTGWAILGLSQRSDFLLKLTICFQLLDHLVGICVELGLLPLNPIDVVAHFGQFLLHPCEGLLYVVEHRDRLECVQTDQVRVHVETNDAFHALVSDKFDPIGAVRYGIFFRQIFAEETNNRLGLIDAPMRPFILLDEVFKQMQDLNPTLLIQPAVALNTRVRAWLSVCKSV